MQNSFVEKLMPAFAKLCFKLAVLQNRCGDQFARPCDFKLVSVNPKTTFLKASSEQLLTDCEQEAGLDTVLEWLVGCIPDSLASPVLNICGAEMR